MADGGETFSCPKCGGPLTADGKNLTVTCPFCGASVVVPESLRPKPTPSAMDILREAAARSAAEDARATPVPQRTGKPSSLLRFGILAVMLVAALVGLTFLENLGSPNDQNSLSQVAGLAATPTVTGFQRDLSADLPRQVSYAGIVYSLTRGEIDNQDRSYDPPVNRDDQAYARLTLRMQNTTREGIYLDPGLFRLHLADGNDYPLDPNVILNADFQAPGPQSTGTTGLVFPVPPGADWEGAVLTIAAPGVEPAELPLSGAMPPAAYPQALQLPAGAQASAQGLDYTLQSAALDLDDGTNRAEQGQRFLKLELQISNASQQYGANISNSNFRLIVDGLPSEPLDAPIQVVNYQTTVAGEVVFQIPANTASATLQVGDVTADSNDFAQVQLDLAQTAP